MLKNGARFVSTVALKVYKKYSDIVLGFDRSISKKQVQQNLKSQDRQIAFAERLSGRMRLL